MEMPPAAASSRENRSTSPPRAICGRNHGSIRSGDPLLARSFREQRIEIVIEPRDVQKQ
jgi:hypothetical protein